MYYEEKVINDVLCWRGVPNGEWHKFSDNVLTDRYIAAKSALAPFIRLAQNMRDAIDGLPDDMQTTIGGGDAQITVRDLRRLLEVKA